MRRILLLVATVAFLASPVLAAGGNVGDLDKKYGFRDVQFESAYSETLGMKLIEESGDNRYYTRPTDELTIGAATLTEISYGYYKSKAAAIHIEAESVNCSDLLLALQEAYGAGIKPNRFMEDRWWLGKRVSMNYRPNAIASTCRVIITSEVMDKQKAADAKAAAKAGASDL